jgi:hypothetical protein
MNNLIAYIFSSFITLIKIYKIFSQWGLQNLTAPTGPN